MTRSPTPPTGYIEVPVQVVHPALYRRHALGLPAGSVRALLAFMVLGLVWALWLLPEHQAQPIPAYLYFLMFLILGHYFAVRHHSPVVAGVHPWPPLYLPRGSIRLLIIIGFAAVLGWGFYSNPDFLERLKPDPQSIADHPYLPLALLGGFFVGIVVARLGQRLLAGPDGLPPWFQDLEAWVALLGMLGLGVEIVIQLIINPSLSQERQINLPGWQGALTAIVAFYFGARS